MLRPVYKYPPRKKAIIPFQSQKPKYANEPEQLIGYIDGIPASDLEERFNKAVEKSRKATDKYFRLSLEGSRGTPGWLELDFLLNTNFGWRAVEVDDISFVHKGEGERQEALLKDIRRMNGLKKLGINVSKIDRVTNENLDTQDKADRWVKENL